MKNLLKKLFAILCVFMMFLSIIPPTEASAATEIASGSCGDNLTWSLTDDGVLTITGVGEMEYIDGENWNNYSNDIRSVIIGDGVTNVMEYAFSCCCNINRVTLPYGLERIDDSAFVDCENLNTINFPEGLISIGMMALHGTNLKTVNIPASVTSIDNIAFNDINGLTDINVAADNMTYASHDGALLNKDKTILIFCPNGKSSYTVPDTVKTIGEYAFCGENITSVTIPDSVIEIEDFAFEVIEKCTIYGMSGSYAETYARQKDMRFIDENGNESENDGTEDSEDEDWEDEEYTEKDCSIELVVWDGKSYKTEQTYDDEYTYEDERYIEVDADAAMQTGGTTVIVPYGSINYVDLSFTCYDESAVITGYDTEEKYLTPKTDGTIQEEIIVKFSDGSRASYKLNIVESDGSNTKLKSLSIKYWDGKTISDTGWGCEPYMYHIPVDQQVAQTSVGADVYIPFWYDTEDGIVFECDSDEYITVEGIKDKYVLGEAGAATAVFQVVSANGDNTTEYRINFKKAPNADNAELENLYVEYLDDTFDEDVRVNVDVNAAATPAGARVSIPENINIDLVNIFGDVADFGRCEINSLNFGSIGKITNVMREVEFENGENVSTVEFDVESADGTVSKTYKVTVILGEDTEVGDDEDLEIPVIKDINDCTISNIPVQRYTGKALTPAITVKDGDKTLVKGTDYTVSYKNNINAGTAMATIEGKNNYTGTITKTFKINKAAIGSKTAIMTLSTSSYTYSKAYKKPGVTVKYGSKVLKNGTDYTVSYKNNYYPGTATATITGKGNYSGSLYKNFTIKVPNLAATKKVNVNLYGYDDLKATWSKVSGATGYYVYYKKSTAKRYTYLGTTIGTTYKKANLSDGAAYSFRIYPYVKINGKTYKDGSYKTSSNVYTLKKVSSPKVSKKSANYVIVSWSNIAGESGYEIARSTKKTSGYKVVKTASYKYKSAKIKTAKNKTYYYKVRAYKTVNGKKIYGPWSSPKSYKLKSIAAYFRF